MAGNVALFAPGHVLRVLVARWLGLPASGGSHLLLDAATRSAPSDYHWVGAAEQWNAALVAEQ